MTQEQKQIKIAEACGWRIKATIKYSWVVISPLNMEVGWSSQGGELNDKPASYYLPDYFSDLNACHDIEKSLCSIDQWIRYEKFLAELGTKFIWHATATQRAEAFGRTLGLWK